MAPLSVAQADRARAPEASPSETTRTVRRRWPARRGFTAQDDIRQMSRTGPRPSLWSATTDGTGPEHVDALLELDRVRLSRRRAATLPPELRVNRGVRRPGAVVPGADQPGQLRSELGAGQGDRDLRGRLGRSCP